MLCRILGEVGTVFDAKCPSRSNRDRANRDRARRRSSWIDACVTCASVGTRAAYTDDVRLSENLILESPGPMGREISWAGASCGGRRPTDSEEGKEESAGASTTKKGLG